MKISVITVCYNAESTILTTLKSVAEQTHEDVEHIIIDGASTDNTLEVVRQHGWRVTTLHSEPDQGLYDAMNKGISRAKGDVIGFLNADDFYTDERTLEAIAQGFSASDVDIVYGDLCYVHKDRPSEIVRYWKSSAYRPGLFGQGWCPPHPTFYVRSALYRMYETNYDTSFKLAADFELIARLIAVNGYSSVYIPRILVNMRLGGETNCSVGNILRQNREILAALKKHGLSASPWRFALRKLFSRGKQFLNRPSA